MPVKYKLEMMDEYGWEHLLAQAELMDWDELATSDDILDQYPPEHDCGLDMCPCYTAGYERGQEDTRG